MEGLSPLSYLPNGGMGLEYAQVQLLIGKEQVGVGERDGDIPSRLGNAGREQEAKDGEKTRSHQ